METTEISQGNDNSFEREFLSVKTTKNAALKFCVEKYWRKNVAQHIQHIHPRGHALEADSVRDSVWLRSAHRPICLHVVDHVLIRVSLSVDTRLGSFNG